MTLSLNTSPNTRLAVGRIFLVAAISLYSSLASAVVVTTPLVVTGNDYLEISDDSESSLLAKRNSVVDIIDGGVLDKAVARQNAELTIDGGIVNRLVASGYSNVNIISGSFGRVVAKKNSYIILGEVAEISRLVLKGNAIVELMAHDLGFDGRFLTGVWSSGSAFSIRTVNKTGVTTNGLPGFVSTYTGNVVSPPTAVPVPAAAWMFMSALVGLGLVARKR